MRWGQLTLVEDDPVTVRRASSGSTTSSGRTCDAVCLSAGGCVAYYPTDVPLHHRSALAGHGDPFGELVAGCRPARDGRDRADRSARRPPARVRRATRTGSRSTRTATGVATGPSAGAWVTCALGPYNFEYMTEVNAEIMARYDVDGIFSNRWTGSGMCYCDALPARISGTACGHGAAAHDRSAGSRSPGLHRLAAAAPVRAVAAVGRRDPGGRTRRRGSSPTPAAAR